MKSVTKRGVVLAVVGVMIMMASIGCRAMRLRAQARDSQIVVLDIGHLADKSGRQAGAQTPDKRYGYLNESLFWYQYVGYTKERIEAAGYTCIVVNRGAAPEEVKLARAGKAAGVIQLNTPQPTKSYRNTHHPQYHAVGMMSTSYAMDQKPAAIIYLHHNSSAHCWKRTQTATVYCNDEGKELASVIAAGFSQQLLNSRIPNGGVNCRVLVRNNGRLGGGDWLNAAQASYIPSAITEITYLNNPDHVTYLNNRQNAILYARVLGESIVTYLKNRS